MAKKQKKPKKSRQKDPMVSWRRGTERRGPANGDDLHNPVYEDGMVVAHLEVRNQLNLHTRWEGWFGVWGPCTTMYSKRIRFPPDTLRIEAEKWFEEQKRWLDGLGVITRAALESQGFSMD
jgi:hypothetical protein